VIYLDTHVLVALYLGDVGNLSDNSKRAIDQNEIYASPAVLLELEFLHEIGRLKPAASRVISALNESIGLNICELPFRLVVNHASGQKWTRDPFDRLIVANAGARKAGLVTKDAQIRRHYSGAIW
jgi:PIN domain nuclease of toxin-antitoxin system